MKKVLLLLAAGVSTLAVAQTESAFMNTVSLGIAQVQDDGTTSAVKKTLAAGTVMCASDHVTMTAYAECDYKQVSLTAKDDAVKALTIDGVTYSCPDGAQGQTNPGPATYIGTEGAQTTGAVYHFTVTQNGWLYVISKLSGNKNYWVWEDLSTPAVAGLVGYNIVAYKAGAEGTEYKYSLPKDDTYGYFAQSGKLLVASDVATPYLTTSWKRDYITSTTLGKDKDKTKITYADYDANTDGIKDEVDAWIASDANTKKLTVLPQSTEGSDKYIVSGITNQGSTLVDAATCTKVFGGNSDWGSDNALGVIAFPVYVNSEKGNGTYTVNACGSKITCNGFVFIPGATSMAAIGASNAIHNITLDELDENAPVYNILGQRVSKGHKGICIQNGKKFIVK